MYTSKEPNENKVITLTGFLKLTTTTVLYCSTCKKSKIDWWRAQCFSSPVSVQMLFINAGSCLTKLMVFVYNKIMGTLNERRFYVETTRWNESIRCSHFIYIYIYINNFESRRVAHRHDQRLNANENARIYDINSNEISNERWWMMETTTVVTSEWQLMQRSKCRYIGH